MRRSECMPLCRPGGGAVRGLPSAPDRAHAHHRCLPFALLLPCLSVLTILPPSFRSSSPHDAVPFLP